MTAHLPEPVRGWWLCGGVWGVIASVGVDPAGAVAALGLAPLLALLSTAIVVQVWAIASALGATPRWDVVATGWAGTLALLEEAGVA